MDLRSGRAPSLLLPTSTRPKQVGGSGSSGTPIDMVESAEDQVLLVLWVNSKSSTCSAALEHRHSASTSRLEILRGPTPPAKGTYRHARHLSFIATSPARTRASVASDETVTKSSPVSVLRTPQPYPTVAMPRELGAPASYVLVR